MAAVPLVTLWKLSGFSIGKIFKYLLHTGFCFKGWDYSSRQNPVPARAHSGCQQDPQHEARPSGSEAQDSRTVSHARDLTKLLPTSGPLPMQ